MILFYINKVIQRLSIQSIERSPLIVCFLPGFLPTTTQYLLGEVKENCHQASTVLTRLQAAEFLIHAVLSFSSCSSSALSFLYPDIGTSSKRHFPSLPNFPYVRVKNYSLNPGDSGFRLPRFAKQCFFIRSLF